MDRIKRRDWTTNFRLGSSKPALSTVKSVKQPGSVSAEDPGSSNNDLLSAPTLTALAGVQLSSWGMCVPLCTCVNVCVGLYA